MGAAARADQPAKKKIDSKAAWREFRELLWVHRRRLTIGLTLMMISRLAGILHKNDHGRAALDAPPWRRAMDRLPWLIVGLVGSAVATLVVGMISKMDWSRIIAVCVIFGILISLGAILGNSSYVQNVAGMSACLQ